MPFVEPCVEPMVESSESDCSSFLCGDGDVFLEEPPDSDFVDHEEIIYDRNEAVLKVRFDGCSLQMVSSELQNDRELVVAAIRRNPLDIKYASSEFRHDREIVRMAVTRSVNAFKFLSRTRWWRDEEIVLASLQSNPTATMNFFHRRDRHRHADDMYLTKTIVLAAVRRDGNNLKYASNALRNDREVVLAALRNNYRAYLHASSELQRDKKILTTALRMNGHLLGIAPKELRGDLEVVMAALDQDPSSLQFASQEFFVALAKLGLDSRQEQQQEPVKGTQKNEEDLTREELLAQNRALRKRLAEVESPRNESATKKPRVK
mmetsp:Transcript_9434/g.22896  ORF Transcript_9434/g.22896 Transcript_9434/m.22896 type:complete len:320 (-) Transcript_9434:1467-2426(-)